MSTWAQWPARKKHGKNEREAERERAGTVQRERQQGLRDPGEPAPKLPGMLGGLRTEREARFFTEQ